MDVRLSLPQHSSDAFVLCVDTMKSVDEKFSMYLLRLFYCSDNVEFALH